VNWWSYVILIVAVRFFLRHSVITIIPVGGLRRFMACPWNLGQESFKVIENGTIQQIIYDFLPVCHYRYHFRVIWRWRISWTWNLGCGGSFAVQIHVRSVMYDQYIAEIYRHGDIFCRYCVGLSSFTSTQRAPEKVYAFVQGHSRSSKLVGYQSIIWLPLYISSIISSIVTVCLCRFRAITICWSKMSVQCICYAWTEYKFTCVCVSVTLSVNSPTGQTPLTPSLTFNLFLNALTRSLTPSLTP